MEKATSNRAALRYVEEATAGTTPTNPVLKNIRYTGESLDYNISTTQSKEIRDDRNVANTVQTKAGSAGDIQFEFSSESFDDFLQAVMCGTWTTTAAIIENCEDAWNETVNANVTPSADSTDFRVGTASAKFVVSAGAAAAEILASEAITSANLTTATHVRLWVKSSVDVAAGALQLLLDDTASLASPLETLNLPALTAGAWKLVTVALATPGALTAVISIGVKQVTDIGAFSLWIDNVVALPDTGVIKNGVTNRAFTIQKHFQDMTTPVFNNFTGQRVGSMMLDFKSGSILTGKFGFMGMGATAVTSQFAGAVLLASGSDVPMNGVNNVQSILEDGVTSVQAYKSITLNLDNSLRAQDAIGSLAPIGIATGTCVVTGSFQAYFSDLTLYNRFLANTSMSLSFKAQDPTGSYLKVTMPAIKIETAKILSSNQDQDVIVDCTYRAIYDEVTGCTLQLDRSYI